MVYRIIVITILLLIIVSCADKSEMDELYRHRHLGGAYFEEDKLAEAIKEFTECIQINPNFAQDHINLGMAYLDFRKYPEAIQEFETAEKLAPGYPHIYYNRAIVYKRQVQFADAAREFQRVIALDPNDVATHYNLGVAYNRIQEAEKARQEFRRVVELEPEHLGAHYQLGRIALRMGNKEEATQELEIFQHLRQAGSSDPNKPEPAPSARSLEEGKYTKVIAPPPKPKERERIKAVPVQFVDVSDTAGLSVRSQETVSPVIDQLQSDIGVGQFGDYDNDGDLDLYIANALYRNNGDGTFTDVTKEAGVENTGVCLSCVWGDYDNDGDLDLYVANVGANVLYQNIGDGQFNGHERFIDVTQTAGVGGAACSADVVFVDYDHDGDLDLYVANFVQLPETLNTSKPLGLSAKRIEINSWTSLPGQDNVLYRNNGDGMFTDVTAEAGVGSDGRRSRQIIFSDFDNDNDTDLFIVNDGAPNILYTNLRGGKFKDVAAHVMSNAKDGGVSATVGDYNADGWMDIYLATGEGKKNILYRNEGGNGFVRESAAKSLNKKWNFTQVSFLDYDNDGYLDVMGIDGSQHVLRLFRNTGEGRFSDVSKATGLNQISLKQNPPFPPFLKGGQGGFTLGDYDNDGDTDILVFNADGTPTLLRNDGGNANRWLKLRLAGRKNSKDGIAAKVEIKGGLFYQKREVKNRTTELGLGTKTQLDAVRVKWPNGIIQNAMNVPANQTLSLTEKEGPIGSCPFLYVWNGEKYIFITDFLDVAALGVLMNSDTYLQPDSDECVKIEGNRMEPRDGLYLMQITEELWETVYLDELKLLAVDHPVDVDVYPNEMFGLPPFPDFHIHAVKNAKSPISAIDHNGDDMLTAIESRDRQYPTNVHPSEYLGFAEEHSIICDFGDLSKAKRILLLLTGWINWGSATTNVAAAQSQQVGSIYLQVINSHGEWETAIPHLGIPAGIDKTATIDLTGKFLINDYRVKITTNFEIYWDRIAVNLDDDEIPMTITPLKLHSADLHWRGYSQTYSPDGQLPLLYDYDTVTETAPWGHAAGRFTRYGDVHSLLEASDNQYVIMSHGDEISVSFDARGAPEVAPGWKRDFILYSSGWIKDGDHNTAFSNTVAPMPFHGMSGYPYPSAERYPFDLAHIQYMQQYNTRRLGFGFRISDFGFRISELKTSIHRISDFGFRN